jgi:hypothetical protein
MYLDCQSTFQVETIGFLWGEVSELRSILSAESYGFRHSRDICEKATILYDSPTFAQLLYP